MDVRLRTTWVWVRVPLQSSYLVFETFQNFKGKFLKLSWMINIVKSTHLIFKEAENRCYVKYIVKGFWKTIKLVKSPFPVMLQTFFTWRSFKGHLDTQGALERHSRSTQGALDLSKGTRRALQGNSRHLGTWKALEHPRHLCSCTLGHSKGTCALSHSGTRVLKALEWIHSAGSEFSHFLLINWLENSLVVLLESESYYVSRTWVIH